MEPGALLISGLAAGLVAGTASCTAVQGGLLVGLAPSPIPVACPSGCEPRYGPESGARVVSLFVAGRLVSHVIAGVLLGLLGGAVQLGPLPRALLLIGAGLGVVVFSVRLLRNGHNAAAHSLTRYRGPAGRRYAPALLGASTILIPCGVTLSTEIVAVSTGSAVGGALVMAGFVIGTAPAFALLGLLLRRVAATRLASLAGIVAIAAGLWTITSGLSLGGWLPDFGSGAAAAQAETRADGTQVITIWATAGGYRPGIVSLKAGAPAEIHYRIAGDAACTRTLTIEGRDVALPSSVRLAPHQPGRLRYVCGTGMYPAFIEFR